MSYVSSVVPLPGVGSSSVRLVPATFWQRLAAGLIDFVLIGVVVFSLGRLCSTSKSIALVLVVPLALAASVYSAVAHALYGRTVGKYLLKIRVVQLAGTPVGWNEALRRSSVDGVFGVVWLTALIVAVSQLPAEAFQGQGWGALYKSIAPLFPTHVRSLLELNGYWVWSEFATMLPNRNRRALHDFIGSTRVVRIESIDGASVHSAATY
jgi:uncharacterized RDD family membrane protein YckC